MEANFRGLDAAPFAQPQPLTAWAARRAFTLVELLVVIAIIAILVSLLLPAVQSAREAARRAKCSNNQRQVAMAIISYESAHNRLPASGQVEMNDEANLVFGSYNPKSGKQFSWAVMILPQMEEQQLYDQFDFSRTIFDQPNLPQQVHVPSYSCPSDGSANRYFQHPQLTDGIRFSKANYVAFVSPYHIDEQVWFPGALGGGYWAQDGRHLGQRLSRIKDGMSKTLMVTEVRTRAQPLDQRGAWALPWAGASQLSVDVHPVARYYGPRGFRVRPEMTFPYAPWEATVSGAQTPNNRGFNVDILYDCVDPAAAQLEGLPCETWVQSENSGYLSAAPRSRHTGGVVAAAMDGHVRFLSDNIDPFVMAYMVSINDGRSSEVTGP